MKAMSLKKVSALAENKAPLDLVEIDIPEPKENEILVKVSVCGVCHTELDEIEGRLPPPKLPVVPGHQVVGRVEKLGKGASKFEIGDRVGVAWIFSACGECGFCMSGNENLCDGFLATGRDVNGGYAEFMAVPEKYAHAIPASLNDAEASPLLCAGTIGYRSLKLARIQDGDTLGLMGFGASAHLVLKMVRYRYPDTGVYVFARKPEERQFARELGAVWAGNSTDVSPVKLNAIIDTTPAWKPVVDALANLEKGGRLVINAIRKEDFDKECLLTLTYQEHLWLEKEVKSVANVTGADVVEFLQLAAEAGIKPNVELFPLEEANRALVELREKPIRGAKVLQVGNVRKRP